MGNTNLKNQDELTMTLAYVNTLCTTNEKQCVIIIAITGHTQLKRNEKDKSYSTMSHFC